MVFNNQDVKPPQKRFFRYKDGAKFYSMSQNTFERLAKEAHAIYRYGRTVLVNVDIVDEYLEKFRVEDEEV